MTLFLADENATLAVASVFADILKEGGLVFLEGTLGAGKTTFSRGLIQALGHKGIVKSPTYTLVEEYLLASVAVYHFDLYRLADPEELEYMGIREYLQPQNLCLVEWPEKGYGVLPNADLTLILADKKQGRALKWQAHTPKGEAWQQALTQTTEAWRAL